MTKIKELRKFYNLTQNEFGERINLTGHNVGDWERGKCEPSITDLIKIAETFDVSIDYLTGRTDEFGNVQRSSSPGLTADEQQLLKNFALLGPFERETILIQINALAKEKSKIK